jgi:hypothetical protein
MEKKVLMPMDFIVTNLHIVTITNLSDFSAIVLEK